MIQLTTPPSKSLPFFVASPPPAFPGPEPEPKPSCLILLSLFNSPSKKYAIRKIATNESTTLPMNQSLPVWLPITSCSDGMAKMADDSATGRHPMVMYVSFCIVLFCL